MAPKNKTPTKKFYVTAGDGRLFEADTQEELNTLMVRSIDAGTDSLRDREGQIRRLQGSSRRTARSQRQETKTRNSSDRSGEKFSKQEWLEMIEEDPLEAQRYLNYHAAGGRDIYAESAEALGVTRHVSGRMATVDFLQTRTDFPQTRENAIALQKYLKDNDMPTSVESLNIAMDELVDDGRIIPLTQVEQDALIEESKSGKIVEKEIDPGSEMPPSPGGVPKPRSGEETGIDEDELMEMDTDTLNQFVEDAGMK